MTPNNPSQPTDYPTLYRLAFARYHTIALWNMTPVNDPTPADALAITRALRTHAGLEGRLLAEQIEQSAHVPHKLRDPHSPTPGLFSIS